MRTTLRVLMALSMAMVLSLSCNLVMPERIQIIGSPTVDVSAGAVNVDIRKYVDLEKMLTDSLAGAFSDPGDSFDSATVGGIYVVNASKRLFSQPLGDIFDTDTGLGGLTQTIEPISFSVPTFTFTQSYTKNLEDDSLGVLDLPALDAVPLLELASGSLPLPIPESGTIDVSDFSVLVLEGGTLLLDLTRTGASVGLDLQVTSAALLDADNVTIATAYTPQAVNETGTLSFDLAGKTLPGELKFQLEVSMEGGDMGSPFSLELAARLENLTVLRAEGVEISELFEGNEPVNLAKPDELVSATIGTGELLITLTPPTGFTGDISNFEASLTMGSVSGRAASPVEGQPNVFKIELDEIVLSSFEEGSLEYSIQVTATNATVDFPAAFGIATELVISEYSQLVLNAEDLDFSHTEPFIIGQDILDAVQSVAFSDARLVFNLTNGLPSLLEISFSSQVLTEGIAKDLTFAGASGSSINQSITLVDSINFATDLVTVGSDLAIDMNLSFSLAGYDAGELTLSGVVPGQEYLFSGNFELVLDLASVTLADVNQSGTFPEDGGEPLDFSALGDFLPDGVKLNDHPTEGLRSWLVVSSGIDADFGVVVLGKYTDSESVVRYVDLLKLEEGELAAVTEGDFLDPGSYATQLLEDGRMELFLATLVNERVSELELAYHLSFAGAMVSLGSAEDQGSLDVRLQLEIPLQLVISPPGGEDGIYWMPEDEFGNPMISFDSDLLGRTEPGDSEDLERVFDYLKRASLRYSMVNEVITGEGGVYPALVIYQGGTGIEDAVFKKTIPFGGPPDALELDATDIAFIRDNLFTPEVRLFLPSGLVTINPEGDLRFALGLRLETDIVHEFAFGKDDSNVQ